MSAMPGGPSAPRRGRLGRPASPEPALLLAAVATGAALVVALWAGTTASVSGLGGWLTGAGQLCGLLGAWGLLSVVALMARLPPLENRIGADRLARWHAFGGRWTISLLVAHALLITWGYAVTAHTGVPHESVLLLRSYPDVLAATVALGLLLLVAGFSVRTARRRVRYETFYWVHFYVYLAAALSFAHQLATGSQLLDDRPARVLWSSAYAVVFGSLAWYRFMVPLRSLLRHRVRVARVHREAPGVVSVLLEGRGLDRLGAESGHFFRLRFLTRDGWWQSHPYSLSAPPHPRMLRFTLKALGDASAAAAALRPGTRVSIEGPYGALTDRRRHRRKVLLIGAGIGISPMRALFETLPAGPGELTLLQRARTEQGLVLRAELERVAQARGARFVPLVGRRGGRADLTAGRLRSLVPDLVAHDVFLCGPEPFMAATTAALKAAGVPAGQVHAERFDLEEAPS